MKVHPWILASMLLVVHSGSVQAGVPSSQPPTLRIQLHLADGLPISQVNAELARLRVRERIPERVILDLGKSVALLRAGYWRLNELAERAGARIDGEASMNDGCFTGVNVAVGENVDKLGDGWLSDQFRFIQKVTKNPDHLGVLYSQEDDGDDRRWLNFYRCRD